MGRVLNFEEIALRIQLAPGGGGGCAVQVTQSSYGSKASCRIDLSTCRLDEGLSRLMEASFRGPRAARHVVGALTGDAVEGGYVSPQEIGDRLFRSLFTGPVLETFLLGLGRVEKQPDTGLRIRLVFDPSLPDLSAISALPWELLYRVDTCDFLARNPMTPLVRYLEVPRLTAPAPLASSLRILVVLSRPHDQDDLDLDNERNSLVAAWSGHERVIIDFLDQPTLLALRRKLIGESYHVLHFMGHGDFEAETGEGVLIFEDSAGGSVPVSGRVLAEALKDSRWLRLVLLNACDSAQVPRRHGQDPFSGVASALVLAGLPAVVAMQFPISDEAALVFSEQFYTALAAGFPVDAAAAEARLAIHLSFPGSWEWATPALFMCVPDGQILRSVIAGRRRVKQPIGESEIPKTDADDTRHLRAPDIDSATITSLSELDKINPTMKREMLARLESQAREFPQKAPVHFALGLTYLDLHLYSQALISLKQALEQGSREPGLNFCIALASLGGKQPRELSFAKIKEVEAHLEVALRVEGDTPEMLVLSAIIKYDYYRSPSVIV